MRIVPVSIWNGVLSANSNGGGLIARLPDLLPEVLQERSIQIRRRDTDSNFLDKILRDSRILIVEGISGSGKDTFQKHLKKFLRHRVVYDYSEGEVLHSWKQLQIEGISKLRVKFMKLFVYHLKDVISRDANAVFLLNRFHLSTYASTIAEQPNLERDYNEIVGALVTLPVHVFILQLHENEIEKRSLHPERSAAWRKFQQQIVDKNTFRDRLERQQKLILEAAKRQNIPYSVLKLLHESEIGDEPLIAKASSVIHAGAHVSDTDEKTSRKKRYLPPTL